MFRKAIAITGLVVAAVAASGLAHAVEFPSKAIKLVVPYAAGGNTDLFARLYAEKLQVLLKQPVVVENRPGASALIGARDVVNAAPDGYTLMYGGTAAVSKVFFKNAEFDILKELAPVARTYTGSTVIFVRSDLPSDLKALIEIGKSSPEKLAYGYSATTVMLPMELLKAQAGISVTAVPYRGSAAVSTAILSGDVHWCADGLIANKAYVDAGQMKIVAVLSDKRMPELPDVPTATELGFPDLVFKFNTGIWAPRGTPSEVIDVLNSAINAATMDPAIQKRIGDLAATPVTETPDKLMEAVLQEVASYARAAETSGWQPAE